MRLASFTSLCLCLLLGFVHQASSGYAWSKGQVHKPWTVMPSVPNPEYEKTAQSIVVSPGQTAVLPCRVRNRADKVVSWIRRKDLHILSSDRFMFTGDSRFQVLHPDGDSAAWSLQLRNPTPKDEGTYECQVNTDPKMKLAVRLTVTDKHHVNLDLTQKDDSNAYGTEMATIVGPKERYVKFGSSLSISCQFVVPTVSGIPTARGHQRTARLVDWLHEDQVLTFSSGGVRIDTEKDGSDVTSHLTLASVTHDDSGAYTCRPYHSKATSITLVVVDGEHSEAMQGDVSAGGSSFIASATLIILLAFTLASI